MLQSEGLHNLHSSSDVLMMKLGRIREEAHAARMGDMRNTKVWSVNQEERNGLECLCEGRMVILD
jgi:hypothetical protein